MKALTMIVMLVICSVSVIGFVSDYYASNYGGNWSNAPQEADGAIDDIVAWDETDNNNELYTYNYGGLAGSGTINFVYLVVRSNFSDAASGDDELSLKFGFDGGNWSNLDGSIYDASNETNQTTDLAMFNYTINYGLTWANLSGIYLGVEGLQVGTEDDEITWIDSIWLRVDYSDLQGPQINQMQPEDGNWSLFDNVVFYYNVTDVLSNVSNCSLIFSSQVNITNTTVNESLVMNFTLSGMEDNVYNWSVNCTDDSENNNENYSLSRILNIDTTPPVIWLETPIDFGEWNTSPLVLFKYNVTDFMTNVSNCSLIIDGSINGNIDTSITEAATINFSRSPGNGNHSWSVNCTDLNSWEGNSTTYNLTVDVNFPNITSVYVENPIIPTIGSTTKILCNATVSHDDGIAFITGVNATFYDTTFSSGAVDNNNNHYTNISCSQINFDTYEANYSCGFDLWYYANNASWTCNVTAVDSNSLTGSGNKSTTVNELFGISVFPNEIQYPALNVGQNTTQDFIINVTNLGNIEIDITLYGYATLNGDGLSMNCSQGNISIDRERYSLQPEKQYSGMDWLSSTPQQIDLFNLSKQTQESINSTKSVYWKMGLPMLISGNCTGNVVIGAVVS